MPGYQQIPNLIQGVSQQAAQHRRDSQAESQYDCINSTVDGCTARPPAEVVKVWAGRDLAGAFIEGFDRTGESYVIGVYDEEPFAINLSSGIDATITGAEYPNTTGYLDASGSMDERDQFRMQAIEDTIFVLNREVPPVMDPSIVSAALVNNALVFWKSGTPNIQYKIALDGSTDYTWTYNEDGTPNIDVPMADAVSNIDGQADWICTNYDSVLYITRADAGAFNINTRDGAGDLNVYPIKGIISSYDRLPQRGVNGFKVKVQGEERTLDDDYWVVFEGTGTDGVWKETVAPSTQTTIDPETMPHALTNTGLNTFTWTKKDWSTRIAGDATVTAKNPGFIGKKVRDLFYHKTRLGFLLEAGAVWSKARFPYTFFPDTVQTVLATAPVDVTMAASGTNSRGAVDLEFPVQIDKTMSFWGQGAQFEISSGDDNFKQDSISADPTTSYEFAPKSRPLSLGKFLYFATDTGDYSGLYAIPYDRQQAGIEVDISGHIQRYIPSGVRRMVGSATTFKCVFVQTDGKPGSLFLWNFLYADQQFVQSAWNEWRIPGGTILWMGLIGNELKVLQQRTEGVALLKFNLTPKATDSISGAEYMTRLDLRVTEAQVTSMSYDSGTGRTTFTLPYTPTAAVADFAVVMAETSGSQYRGKKFVIVSIVGAVVTVEGDLSGGKKFYAGERIRAERTESQFFVRTEKGPVAYDSLTVNRYGVELHNTGYSRIEVRDLGDNLRAYEAEGTGLTVGLPGSLIGTGTPKLGKGMLSAGVDLKTTGCKLTLVNDSFLPSYWQSGYYEFTAVGKMGEK